MMTPKTSPFDQTNVLWRNRMDHVQKSLSELSRFRLISSGRFEAKAMHILEARLDQKYF